MSYEKPDINNMTRNEIEQHIAEVTNKQELLRIERDAVIKSKNDKALQEIKKQILECLKFE